MSMRDRTSTPCVGSSMITTDGSVQSTRLIATFCWLPPDREVTACSRLPTRMP